MVCKVQQYRRSKFPGGGVLMRLRLLILVALASCTRAQTPAPPAPSPDPNAPAAPAPAPSPLPTPSIAGPLQAAPPLPIGGETLPWLFLNGAVSGMGVWQGNYVAGDDAT